MEYFVALAGGVSNIARRLGWKRTSVSAWHNGRSLPPLEVLLECSFHFGISLTNIFNGQLPPLGEYLPKRCEIGAYIQDKVHNILCSSNPPKSLRELYDRVGFSKQTVLKYVPNAKKLLASGSNNRQKDVEGARQLSMRNKGDREKARLNIQYWLNQDEVISPKEIASRSGIGQSTFRYCFIDLYEQASRRYAISKQMYNCELITKLRVCTLEPSTSQKSLSQIARELNTTSERLLKLAPELCNKIRINYSRNVKNNRKSNRRVAPKMDRDTVLPLVAECLREVPAISIREFMNRHGCSIKRYPDLVGEIKENRRRWKEQLENKKCEIISQAVYKVHSSGHYPSALKVAELTQISNILRNKAYRSAWKEALAQVGSQ